MPHHGRCQRHQAAKSAAAPPKSSTASWAHRDPRTRGMAANPAPIACRREPATQSASTASIAGKTLYAAWWWIVAGLALAAAWVAVMVLPRLDLRWRAIRGLARAALAAAGAPVTVEGLDRLPSGNAILVFNHSSYMDVAVLAAVLRGEPVYVAKREFNAQFFAGHLMRRLGTLFVQRYDTSASVADTDKAIAVARQGRNLICLLSRGLVHTPGRAFRILSRRLQGSC